MNRWPWLAGALALAGIFFVWHRRQPSGLNDGSGTTSGVSSAQTSRAAPARGPAAPGLRRLLVRVVQLHAGQSGGPPERIRPQRSAAQLEEALRPWPAVPGPP